MPGPCDPGSPRELQDGTNTLGPVLHWPGKQEGKKGERSERALGRPVVSCPVFCLCPFCLSPEQTGARSHQSARAAC